MAIADNHTPPKIWKDDYWNVKFRSTAQLLYFITRVPNKVNNPASIQPDSWKDLASWEDSLTLYKCGDKKLTKIVDELVKKDLKDYQLKRATDKWTLKPIRSMIGVRPLPEYVNEPEHMRSFKRTRVSSSAGRLVKLIVNCSLSCHISVPNAIKAFAKVFSLIQILKLNGINTEITIASHHTYYPFKCSTTLKTFEEAFDLSKLVFCIINPSFFRRFIFGAMERMPAPIAIGCHSHYGVPSQLDPKDFPKDAIIFPLFNGDQNQYDTQLQQLKDTYLK
jgi:hypothetical protein